MSIVTASRPMRTTRPVTTSPCFGCFRLRSKRAPKSSSAPIARSGCFVVSGIKVLPPVGGISGGTQANRLHILPSRGVFKGENLTFRALNSSESSPLALAHQALHAVHHLFERERGGVEDDGVGGRPQRRVGARGVAPVALRELAGERRLVDPLRPRAQLGRAPRRPRRRVSGQIELHRGVRE